MTDTLTICALEMGAIDDGNGDPIGWTVPMSQLREIARACLQAAADNVSEEMLKAGIESDKDMPVSFRVGPETVQNVFTAMITAIVGEKG